MTKKIVFLMSDTGGGHRAAAEAIRDALYERYGRDQIEASMVDVYKSMHFPASTMPEFYPWIVNHGKMLWALAYRWGNRPANAEFTNRITYQWNAAGLRRMARQNQGDVIVCVHSVTGHPAMSAYQSLPERPPFVTIVTDLVSTPVYWYDSRVDRCLVPTQAAYDRGLKFGMKPEQMRITGLPVHPNFNRALSEKSAARTALGWEATLPTVLMVAGGDGMGPLYETARAIVEKKLNCQIAVVAGRNKSLKARLDSAAEEWRKHQPVHVYGFVTNMPQMMAGADMLVTKAGPATISEACIAGLPVILSDAIPGQEDGNIDYVVENNIGVYAPNPAKVANAVAAWLAEGIDALRARGEHARAISHPQAVWEIADEVWDYAQRPIVKNTRRPFLRKRSEQ